MLCLLFEILYHTHSDEQSRFAGSVGVAGSLLLSGKVMWRKLVAIHVADDYVGYLLSLSVNKKTQPVYHRLCFEIVASEYYILL